jgi:hypothetical protein
MSNQNSRAVQPALPLSSHGDGARAFLHDFEIRIAADYAKLNSMQQGWTGTLDQLAGYLAKA